MACQGGCPQSGCRCHLLLAQKATSHTSAAIYRPVSHSSCCRRATGSVSRILPYSGGAASQLRGECTGATCRGSTVHVQDAVRRFTADVKTPHSCVFTALSPCPKTGGGVGYGHLAPHPSLSAKNPFFPLSIVLKDN